MTQLRSNPHPQARLTSLPNLTWICLRIQQPLYRPASCNAAPQRSPFSSSIRRRRDPYGGTSPLGAKASQLRPLLEIMIRRKDLDECSPVSVSAKHKRNRKGLHKG